MNKEKQDDGKNVTNEYPWAESPFCEEFLPPKPVRTVTVMHKTVGGKGEVARIREKK
jgi:hypothetical protein